MLKRRIPARDVVEDIHAGLSNSAIKDKYDLSEALLGRLFEKLYAARMISDLDYQQRMGAMSRRTDEADQYYSGLELIKFQDTPVLFITERIKGFFRRPMSGLGYFVMGLSASMIIMVVILGVLYKIGPINSQIGFIIPGGTEVNAADENGVTFLMKAALQGNVERVKTLIRQGANVNAMDKDSETALMAAAFNGNEQIVHILLEKGAIVGIRNNRGASAIDIARLRGHMEVARILVTHMGKQN